MNYETAIIINYMEFTKKLKGDLNLFLNELEEERKKLKKISGYMFDNANYRFSNIYGTEFSFSIYEEKYKEISTGKFYVKVWDYLGQTSIFNREIFKENEDEFIKDLLFHSDKWSQGEVKCSECNKWISYQENRRHTYFAGIYCSDCWEGKWKAIEAKESYN
jgi:hypothetical protein